MADCAICFRSPCGGGRALTDAEVIAAKWEARMRANGEWLKRAEHKIGEAEMFSERESQ